MTPDEILQLLESHLNACKTGSADPALAGLMPGIRTVFVGDQIVPDSQQPAVTLEWANEDFLDAGPGPAGVLWQTRHELEVCLYQGAVPKGTTPSNAARALYSSDNGNKGLRRALLSLPAGTLLLWPTTARILRPSEKPDFRFAAGLLIRCLVQQLGRR